MKRKRSETKRSETKRTDHLCEPSRAVCSHETQRQITSSWKTKTKRTDLVLDFYSACLNKPFFISFLSWSKVMCHPNHFKIKKCEHTSGFTLNLALASFFVWAPNFAILIFINWFKKERVEMLLRICLVYAWFTLVYGPPCLSVNNLVYCKWFFLRIAFYFCIYILYWVLVWWICGWYTIGKRGYTVLFLWKPFSAYDCRQELHVDHTFWKNCV